MYNALIRSGGSDDDAKSTEYLNSISRALLKTKNKSGSRSSNNP